MNPRIRKVMALMHKDLSSHLTLPEMARVAGYTTPYFCAVFKSEVGVPPARYHKLLRLKQAQKLLETKQALYLCVSEVAAQTGFGNMSHFVRDFEKAFGMSPKRYQTQHWEKSNGFGMPV